MDLNFFHRSVLSAVLAAVGLLAGAPAWALAGQPSEKLPVPTSSHDPLPTPSTVRPIEDLKVVGQAGVGSDVAYGRAGVLELGGHLSFVGASGQTQLAVAPSIGWFLVDNLELSALISVNTNSIDGHRSTWFSALAEPSVHLPVADNLFVFGGLGVGATYQRSKGTGLALAPRLGLNLMVGRSGVLSPSISYNWASFGARREGEATLVAMSGSVTGNIGYTVMW